MLRVDDVRFKLLNPAAEKGDIDLVKKIIQDYKELNVKPNSLTVKKALISGNIALLKYFEETFQLTPLNLTHDEMNDAMWSLKSQEMFKHLLTQYRGIRLLFDAKTTEIVARSGNVENLKLLLSARPFADSDTLYGAVESRNMDCIRFLVEDYKIDGELVITDYDDFDDSISLAQNNKLDEIAEYLRGKKAQLNPAAIASANNTNLALGIPQFGDFPDLKDLQSSKGTSLRPDATVKIEYQGTPPGFKFQFGYDKERGRSGHLIVAIDDEKNKTTNKP